MPLVRLPLRGGKMCREESAEAIFARATGGEGPNFVLRAGTFAVRVTGEIEGRAGMRVDELGAFLRAHWPKIRERLCRGEYEPMPVRRVQIPKLNGGMRALGIPTVLAD